MRTLTNTRPWEITAEFPLNQGKVRDVYDLGDRLVMIATDRLSAYDVVLEESPISGRGIILTQMTLHWLNILKDTIRDINSPIPIIDHVVSTEVADLPEAFKPHARALTGRFMLVDKCLALPTECIVRGYISGSMCKEVTQLSKTATGDTVTWHGHTIPTNLLESQELPSAIFTPSTKAPQGEHDINISYDEMIDVIRTWMAVQDLDLDAEELTKVCHDLSLALYTAGRDYALQRGIIIADTKFEFGLKLIDGVWHLVIIDEVLTPDSSRFWPVDEYEPGRSQNSFDKQIVRDYLAKVLKWDKQPPVPKLPSAIILQTMNRYRECAELLGVDLPRPPINIMLIFGSRNDYTDGMRAAVGDARKQYCTPGGPFGRIDVHVASMHRNTYDCIALAENRISGIDLNDIDGAIYAAGWANHLTGTEDALQYHNRQFIPVFGLAIGEDGTREFEASKLSCECLPSHPVFLDVDGQVYCNAQGLRAIFQRLATQGLPQVKPRKEKPAEWFIDVG